MSNQRTQFDLAAIFLLAIVFSMTAACNSSSLQHIDILGLDYQCSNIIFENIAETNLHDNVNSFASRSLRTGIKPYRRNSDLLRDAPKNRRLVEINPNNLYSVSRLTSSYPYLTREASDTLDNIAQRFQANLINTSLSHMRIQVTSLLRSEESQNALRKVNANATSNANPPHTHGTSFDISYETFTNMYGYRVPVSSCQKRFLRSILTKSLVQTKNVDNQIHVIKEVKQTCFHVTVCKRTKTSY